MTIIDVLKMNCRQATLLSEKQKEGKISAMEKFGLWWHTVVVCKFCRLFFKQTDLLAKAGAKAASEVRAELDAAKKEELKRLLSEEVKK